MNIKSFIEQERKRLGGHCYSNYPYCCSSDEAIIHLMKYDFLETATIERTDKETIIYLKPLKNKRRKMLKWRLWR